jgi:hypothetical protein
MSNPTIFKRCWDRLAGSNGTWVSRNPLVMSVNQQGYAMALTPGTTNITYTSPTGVKFSEWTMTVVAMP